MKVTVYGTKRIEEVVEIDDKFKQLADWDEELPDLEIDLLSTIKDKLGYSFEIDGVWSNDLLLYES